MNMNTEPVRIPMWAATVITIAINLAIALLSNVDWKAAVAQSLGSLAVLVGGTEVARGKAWSPDSVRQVTQPPVARSVP